MSSLGSARDFPNRRFTRGTDSFEHEPIRVGVIGLGYWGPNLLRVLADNARAEVTWVCDLDPDRLSRFGRRYPAVQTTNSFDDLLDDESLDAIVIATPVHTHHELASCALEAGKHVFVEKPLAASSAEAEELVGLSRDMDRVLMCGHTFLYSPPVRAVRQLIERGDLGDIYFVSSSRVNLGLHQRDVSVIWDLGPHDFSILLYWLGELPETVAATGRDAVGSGVPDVAFISLTFPSGPVAHVELSWLSPSKLRRTAIAGSKKMVVYDDMSPEPVKIFDHGVVYEDPETFGEYHLSYRTGDVLSPKLEMVEPIAVQLDEFIESIRRGSAAPGHDELALNVVRLAEAAQMSLDTGGGPVSLEVAELTR